MQASLIFAHKIKLKTHDLGLILQGSSYFCLFITNYHDLHLNILRKKVLYGKENFSHILGKTLGSLFINYSRKNSKQPLPPSLFLHGRGWERRAAAPAQLLATTASFFLLPTTISATSNHLGIPHSHSGLPLAQAQPQLLHSSI